MEAARPGGSDHFRAATDRGRALVPVRAPPRPLARIVIVVPPSWRSLSSRQDGETTITRPIGPGTVRWTPAGDRLAAVEGIRVRYADLPTEEASIHVAAPPEAIWPLVTDLDLLAELSAELQQASWNEGVTGAALGRTFRGRNVHPSVGEWETVSTVVEYDAPRSFAWAVMDPKNPTAVWRFTLTPDGDGTELRQWARMGPGWSFLNQAIERTPDKEERIVARRLEQWRAGMEANLAGIKERAERMRTAQR